MFFKPIITTDNVQSILRFCSEYIALHYRPYGTPEQQAEYDEVLSLRQKCLAFMEKENERNIYFAPNHTPPPIGDSFYINDISTHEHIHGVVRGITPNEELGGYDVIYTIL